MRKDTPLEIVVGDVVELRKQHPCGSKIWTVTGLGADIRMRCEGCGRRVLMPRRTLEKRLKRFVSRGPAMVLAEEILAAQAVEESSSPDAPED
ncbi:MAG TPA: DUF951 domain-containing protein [Thermomicrobiales bacterium]|nr:DUF951 domain-containing protein [Thermomicrobiales bacterium]